MMWRIAQVRLLSGAAGILFGLAGGGLFAAEKPQVVRWDFGSEESTPLQSHGGVHRDVPGPRPPEYPDFDAGNTAVKLDGRGAYLSYEDPGPESPFDYTNGDGISLEAWVQVDELHAGENVYVIGKGRTGSAGFASDNQNWALRVRESNGKACVSFLFATPQTSGATKSDDHWHRWTTKEGFAPGKGWHHIAVSYRFGEPKSVKGWIDGKPQAGKWDMGGDTAAAPVVDNDAIWIGSSRGGAAANSFRGHVDAVAIHRELLDDATVKGRFRRTGDEIVTKPLAAVMPELVELPAGKVLMTLHEGLPAHNRWLNEGESLPPEALRIPTEHFLLDRLPLRYDEWGIRTAWKAPVLMRLSADVALPPGKHRFLLRTRGLSRLWVNGELIATAKPVSGSPSGEEPITPVATPPLPGLRIAEHRQQEVFGEATIGADGACRVILETMVGGKAFRADPGEMCVAVQPNGGSTMELLRPVASTMPVVKLTDSDVISALARQEAVLREVDERNRHAAAVSQDEFWQQRHAQARAWAKEHPAPTAPATAKHPIDGFLQAKWELAVSESAKTPLAQAQQFHRDVLPLLRDSCFRCHGDKENGGLRLNSRDAILKGGDSEVPAVVPGDLSKSELIRRLRSTDPDERMPPGANPLSEKQIAVIEAWVKEGAHWPAFPVRKEDVSTPAVVSDTAFARRVYFDTVGVPPSEQELQSFLNDAGKDKRERLVEQLLRDDRGADHWVSYWQDVLAENPTLINPSLNTTGPFRWFLYESLKDNKPFDRFVYELIMLRGSSPEGGSAGFGIAADNDAPFAAKGQIIANAFLGIELQCARCHDSPYHSTKQRDLYSLAAMFERKPVTVPKTSRVPLAFFENKSRESLIKVSLKPDEAIPPKWPFAEVTGSADDAELVAGLQNPKDSREQLAVLITSPHNARFAQVIVNRVWRRLIGAGFVEPAQDWEGHAPSHPELLQWLANEFVAHDYDVKHVMRLILTSQVYQREATGHNLAASAEVRFFVAPERRRLTAEQLVDTLFTAAGQPIEVEELTFDPDGRRPASNRLSLGIPSRGWMFASLANERDRPSLGLPKAQAVTDIMEAFGWTGSRQNPRTDRETAPHLLQPGVLANSTASTWLTRASLGSGLAEIAVTADSPEQVVDRLFLRYLSRMPSATERQPFSRALAVGFAKRLTPADAIHEPASLEQLPKVTWSNHLRPESTTIAMELERRARLGPPADPRLNSEWREVYEDVVWSIINTREFAWLP